MTGKMIPSREPHQYEKRVIQEIKKILDAQSAGSPGPLSLITDNSDEGVDIYLACKIDKDCSVLDAATLLAEVILQLR